MTQTLQNISDHMWEWMAYAALLLGFYFTFRMRAVQLRRFPDMMRQIAGRKVSNGAVKDQKDEGISSFQALSMTLASRVGVGAIGGVATAIGFGGPGAIFWMAVTGFVGAASSYAESVLAQIYKRKIDGEHRGGIPYYIRYGLGWRWLAVIAALVAFLGYGFLVPGIQSNNISNSVDYAFNIPGWVSATVVTALLAVVLIGGTKRIVNVAQTVVPFMAVGYIIIAIVVILLNITAIPETVTVIIGSAFGANQIFGGIAGYAVAWGIRRAIFTSVAGIGEGTFGAAAAHVSHPGKQGLVQAFSIYVDVLFVCMATGTLIVATDSYDVVTSAGETIHTNLNEAIEVGPQYAQHAIDATLHGFGSPFVAVAIFLFAFTSQVAFFYIAQSNLQYLTGQKENRAATWILKLGALVISFIGGVVPAQAMWAAGDIGYATLGWINMVVLVLLSPIVIKVYRDYEKQRKAGLEPHFHPEKLGIRNADFWTERKTASGDPEETHIPVPEG